LAYKLTPLKTFFITYYFRRKQKKTIRPYEQTEEGEEKTDPNTNDIIYEVIIKR
jgi:hypothetical protein